MNTSKPRTELNLQNERPKTIKVRATLGPLSREPMKVQVTDAETSQMTGADLKALRKSLGVSLAQAAVQLAISARSIARWEANKNCVPLWQEQMIKKLRSE